MFYEENIDKLNFLKQYFKNYELTLQKKNSLEQRNFGIKNISFVIYLYFFRFCKLIYLLILLV